ncbi:hypothetical protein ACFSCZ_00490 [Siminovitchia sediminis]|uniref:Uncharacterized protein n=1 Tax=Siminovitchia sediminis TaxID=1274353 RepID=A0ABW4KCI9_9BACI
MDSHKGAITLILVVLIIFGIFVAFATGVFDPIMTKISNGFNNMVDSVFSGSGMNWGGAK